MMKIFDINFIKNHIQIIIISRRLTSVIYNFNKSEYLQYS